MGRRRATAGPGRFGVRRDPLAGRFEPPDEAMIRRVLEMVAASAATSKVEAFNNFCQWLFFGKHGMFADNEPDEQEKTMKTINFLLRSRHSC